MLLFSCTLIIKEDQESYVQNEKWGENIGIILEFKVRDAGEEHTLEDTAEEALAQIERQNYKAALTSRGIEEKRIYSYGFAFEGKKF